VPVWRLPSWNRSNANRGKRGVVPLYCTLFMKYQSAADLLTSICQLSWWWHAAESGAGDTHDAGESVVGVLVDAVDIRLWVNVALASTARVGRLLRGRGETRQQPKAIVRRDLITAILMPAGAPG